MSKPTGISLKDFCKAIEISSIATGYSNVKYKPKGGSAYTFSFFEKGNEVTPCAVFAVHVGHNKKKEIWSDDLKKVWERTAIKEDVFMDILNSF